MKGELIPEPALAATPEAADPRPRTLVVGEPAGWAPGPGLEQALELRRASAEGALREIAADAVAVLLLDGRLPCGELSPILERLGPPGRAGRPVVLVVTAGGQRTHVEARLVDHADDFVNGLLGEEVLLARIRMALRLKAAFEELSRKNAELQEMGARFESLARRMSDELRLAANLQRSLLPPPLVHPRLDLAREFLPFREVGGDYFDLVPLGDARLAIAIGDVMGKGLPAALLAAHLKACLRAHLQGGEVPVEEVVTGVNQLFGEVTPKGLFASLFFGIFDLEHGTLEYANAGHDYPFLVAEGGLRDLADGGAVLGLLENVRYERGVARIEPGDLVVFYSDGVTDRENAQGEGFGVERLKQAALRSRRDPARIALYTLLGEVQGWSSGTPPEDDMTLVVARLL